VERNSLTCHCHNSDHSHLNLSLLGRRESLVGDSSPGNFLALLKFLAKYDLFTREHLDPVSGKPGCLCYFSPDIQNELINLLGVRLRRTVFSSVQKARYCSIMFDATSDNVHTEHMSQIVRFIEMQRNSGNQRCFYRLYST
jgi:hypothetical protein